jgi:SAM-dependent methyltransferase
VVASSAEAIERLTTTRACAWCGGPLDSSSTRLAGRVWCEGCGVANTDPWPSETDLDAAYGGWYRPPTGRFSGRGDAILRRTRGQLARRLDRIAPPGPILDVGAGDGALLDALSARGRRALGVEREATRPDIHASGLSEIDGRWAAVVFWHSLEHLASPGEAIELAADLLAPDGVLVIAVPNAASVQARLFGDRWLGLDLPRHLVHLPAQVLVERLRSLKLDVGRVSFWRGGQVWFGWLHGLVGALPGRPDLYDAIRRPEARSTPLSASTRPLVLGAGVLMAPLAAVGAAAEIAARRGGTVYVEARRA